MKLIGPFKQLLPMTGLPLKGALSDAQMVVLEDVAILIEDDIIVSIDKFKTLKIAHKTAEIHELKGNHTCLPGLIDSNTQICFGGSSINKDLWETVTETRNTTKEILAKKTAKLANRHLKNGTTTIEVKSGYGLSVTEELKILYAIKEAQLQTSVDLIASFFVAQSLPNDFDGSAENYLATISEELFPILKDKKLTNRIAVSIDESGFLKEQLAPFLKRAEEMGFHLSITEMQISKSGSDTSDLKNGKAIITALAGTSIGLGTAFAPVRKILDAGGTIAIASNHNPITAPMGDLLTQAAILGAFQKLTNTEVLSGITFRAAAALNLKNRGQLAVGKLADFILFHTNDYREILYNQGSFKPCVVYKKGQVVFDKHK